MVVNFTSLHSGNNKYIFNFLLKYKRVIFIKLLAFIPIIYQCVSKFLLLPKFINVFSIKHKQRLFTYF